MDKRKIRICIFAAAMMQMCFVGLAAAIADIAKAFPQYSLTVIQTGVTSINLIGFFTALLVGWLATRYSKKIITIVSLLLIAIGGLGGFLFHGSLPVFYCWSFVIGAGLGGFTPAVASLIVDHFEEDERAKISGLQTSFINGGGVLLTFGGGLLASIAWYDSYLAFLVAVPVLIICAICMPMKNKYTYQKTEKQKLPPIVFYYTANVFMAMLTYYVFVANISVYVSEKGLGHASLAGTANAVFMIGGVACGFIFPKLSHKFGEYLFSFAHILLLIGFVLLNLHASIPVLMVAAFIGGCSISLALPQSIFSVSSRIPPSLSASAMSMISSVAPCLATFASPAVFAFLSHFVSDAGDVASRFTAASVVCTICAVVFAIITRTRSIKEKQRAA
jgi:MFS family permease